MLKSEFKSPPRHRGAERALYLADRLIHFPITNIDDR
jgi:hypothetical protein